LLNTPLDACVSLQLRQGPDEFWRSLGLVISAPAIDIRSSTEGSMPDQSSRHRRQGPMEGIGHASSRSEEIDKPCCYPIHAAAFSGSGRSSRFTTPFPQRGNARETCPVNEHHGWR